MFENIQSRGVDQILALMLEFRADPRPDKVDLVVGVYKDANGRVPVMHVVKQAEARLTTQEDSKTYVGMAGDAEFRALVPGLLLGAQSPLLAQGRVTSLQTPGGSGAIKVGCDLLNAIDPGKRLWVSTPTWANHEPVAQDAGLSIAHHPYFRPSDRGLDFDAMVAHLKAHARPGDAILLHACCHNPTGVDLSFPQWGALTRLLCELEILPFVDCAYQGLGRGLEADMAGLRHMAEAVPEMLIANSFSKNFAIYRERTGALTLIAKTPDQLAGTQGATETVIRSNYSMPPSHGARIVATIMGDPDLKAQWEEELSQMRTRIAQMRNSLRAKLEERQITQDLSFLTDQMGMFSYTGFGHDQVHTLRDRFGIYVAEDGRINVAALSEGNLDVVAEGFAAVM